MSEERLRRPDLDPGDLSAKGIAFSGVGLAVLVVVAALLMWGASVFLRDLEAAKDVDPGPLAAEAALLEPVGPLLQTDPITDIRELRAEEEEILGSYEWIDREAGLAQIPIERAMELLVALREEGALASE